MTLLEAEEVRAGYGRGMVLHGISFAVQEGQTVTILGPNGAGKTTTLRAISGMIRTEGTITFDGRKISGSSPDAIARAGIAHVPEGRGTFTELTTEENLYAGAYTRRDKAGVKKDVERSFEWFPRLGERRDQLAGSMSGGEQQMLAIARALMLRPKLLLLDEPSLGLAPLITQEVFRIVADVAGEEGLSVLVVEQNANLVLKRANYAYVLESGRIAIDGDAQTVQSDEGIRRAYLGY